MSVSRAIILGFELHEPLPARGSALALRERLIKFLMDVSPPVGDRFLSDHDLTRVSGLSRPTVRKALDALQREGWIERRHGRGTFVGPRVALTLHRRGAGADATHHRLARVAVATQLHGSRVDWYAQAVIAGIDAVADEMHIAIEMLGYSGGDVAAASRRLAKNPPDVIAFSMPSADHILLAGEARRLGIPCIGAGGSLHALNIPRATEDGVQGGELAVQHLAAHGHRRIGLVVPTYVSPWVFTRRQGYLNGLTKAGIEPDERLVLWYPGLDIAAEVDLLERYLDKHQPTALVFANFGGVATLGHLVARGRLQIPRDLSVVHFDQHPDAGRWLGVPTSATVALPLEAMGRRMAEMARQVADGQSLGSTVTEIPCQWTPGESILTLNGYQLSEHTSSARTTDGGLHV
jgi:LacI family transcriptional regulator